MDGDVEACRISGRGRQKYRTHPGVGGVNLHEERETGIGQSEDECGHEGSLQLGEGCGCLGVPLESPLLSSEERGKGCRNQAITPNKPVLKVSKS